MGDAEMRAGIIGFGRMGRAVAQKLVENNYEVYGWNRTVEKIPVDLGVNVEATPADVASTTDITIIAVSDNNAVERVVFGPGGIFERRGDSVIAMLSTITPDYSDRLSLKLAEKGYKYVEAPVLGGPKTILKEEIVALIAGGDGKNVVEKVYRSFSKNIFDIGEIPKAMAVKLAFNSLFFVVLEALAESMTVAAKWGISTEIFKEISDQLWTKCITDKYYERGLKERGDAGFTLELAAKDLAYALRASWLKKVVTPAIAGAEQCFLKAVDSGYGEKDYPSIIRFLLKSTL
jgi:3-hydroxyisobutyrate dehydrogenase